MLLLTAHFPPCAAVAVHRMLGLVRHMPAHGWESIVVAPPSMPHEPNEPAPPTLLTASLRASPLYDLVLYDRLPAPERTALAELAQDPGFYGVLPHR